jgi:hypothetical protein
MSNWGGAGSWTRLAEPGNIFRLQVFMQMATVLRLLQATNEGRMLNDPV